MANQDQHVQNCTDNGTIEKEDDEMRKLSLSESNSNLSMQPFNETVLDEILEPEVALDYDLDEVDMCPPPSFYRTTLDEKEGITEDEQFAMPRGSYFIVRRMISTYNNVPLEDDWEIPEELAVCNFCFKKFIVQEIMMKTKCGCKDALVHEACSLNKKCDSCRKNVDKIKVTLLIKPNSFEVSEEKWGKKWKVSSLFKW